MGIVIIILLIIGITFSIGAVSAAPWVPMRVTDVQRVIAILQKIKPGQNFVELGSGDGRLLAAVSALGYNGTGYEISVLPLIISWLRKLFSKSSYRVYVKNFWQADLSEANIIFTFLIPRVLEKYKTKAETETKPGTIFINYVWPIPGWEPILIDKISGHNTIYVYERQWPKNGALCRLN